jgi:hypothetical protein
MFAHVMKVLLHVFHSFSGCFKYNFPVVTIYTNLGESGVQYGISQTQAEYVLVSQASFHDGLLF